MKFGMISRGTFPKKISAHTGIIQGSVDADVVINYGVQGTGKRAGICQIRRNRRTSPQAKLKEKSECPGHLGAA